MTDSDKTPFWKIPMMWLVIGLPLASIVAGVSLVVIAVRSGGADVVRDEVQRVSQIQTTDLGPDAHAQELGLSAIVRIDDKLIEVIPVTGDFRRSAPLQLVLGHPTRAAEDVTVVLVPGGNGWSAEAVIDGNHDWSLELAAEDGSWRLQGRLPKQQQAARVAPSLQP